MNSYFIDIPLWYDSNYNAKLNFYIPLRYDSRYDIPHTFILTLLQLKADNFLFFTCLILYYIKSSHTPTATFYYTISILTLPKTNLLVQEK
jgi:hypothetical protein